MYVVNYLKLDGDYLPNSRSEIFLFHTEADARFYARRQAISEYNELLVDYQIFLFQDEVPFDQLITRAFDTNEGVMINLENDNDENDHMVVLFFYDGCSRYEVATNNADNINRYESSSWSISSLTM